MVCRGCCWWNRISTASAHAMSQARMELRPAREPRRLPAWLVLCGKVSEVLLNSPLRGAVAERKAGRWVKSAIHHFKAERKGIIVELRIRNGPRSVMIMSFHYLRWPSYRADQVVFLQVLFSFLLDDLTEVDFHAAARAIEQVFCRC